MKKSIIALAMILAGASAVKAQETTNAATASTEVTPSNSWIKLGITAGMPLGSIANTQNLNVGLDLRGQLMQTGHFGIGLATGFNHYFAKENQTSIDIIPAAGMVRYYPKSEGIFVGTDLGYNFVLNDGMKGGVFVNPQIGYHNRNWNIYGYYNHTFNNTLPLKNIGVGATYNIRFEKKK